MAMVRKRFQGIANVVRFNWHLYVVALSATFLFLTLTFAFQYPLNLFSALVAASIIITVSISLIVTYYIYDRSNLYTLDWIRSDSSTTLNVINVNAGFDETSVLLENKFTNCNMIAIDFYNVEKHTEVSIKRARKAYPLYLGTLCVSTNDLPLATSYADKIFAILSAHEIRDEQERTSFFKELHRVLKPSGQIIVTEHLRDLKNFLAYNIGFFHFHSKSTWNRTFREAGLVVTEEFKITPFITTFVLEKNAVAS